MNADDKDAVDCAIAMARYMAEKTGYTVADTLGPAATLLAGEDLRRTLREMEITAGVYDVDSPRPPPMGVKP